MACFLVPMAEAVVVDVIRRSLSKNEYGRDGLMEGCGFFQAGRMASASFKLSWLSQLLWGVSLLLMLEHAWTGEVTLFFPFLTALSSSESTMVMLRELLTVGLPTALLVTFIWGVIVLVDKRVMFCTRKIREKLEI